MAGIDTNTKLMLHCNGTDGSTTFTDSSGSEHTMTANGNAQIDTAQSVFGGASGLFDGSGDYVSAPDSDDFYLSGDFTIDFRIRWNGTPGATGVCGSSQGGGAQPKYALYGFVGALGMGSSLGLHISTGSDIIFDTWSPSADTWYHVAIVRNGNNFYLFVDGTQVGTTKTSPISFPNVSSNFRVGSDGEGWQHFNGHLDEYRLSNTARWTSNFTPPTSEYSSDDDITVEPETLTSSLSVQSPFVQISSSVLVSTSLLNSSVETPEAGSIIIIEPTVFSVGVDLQSPQINITSTIQPDTLTVETVLETVSTPGLYSLTNVKKIISYNPLVVMSDTDPIKLGKVDISDPDNPVVTVYTFSEIDGADDVTYDSVSQVLYVACNDGKILEIDATDFNTYIVHETGVLNTLKRIILFDGYQHIYASSDKSTGELVYMDDTIKTVLDMDVRWIQQISRVLECQVNTVLALSIDLDVKWNASLSKSISTDVRFMTEAPTEYLEPISRLDFNVYLDSVQLDDVIMDSITIYHTDSEKSRATFAISRVHDDLDYTLEGVASQITNQNAVRITINGHTEFEGKIHQLDMQSDDETVQVTAYSSELRGNERSIVNLSIPSKDEQLHVYHALVHNPVIENPYLAEDEQDPSYYKGIFVDGGYDEKQNVSRWSSFREVGELAEKVQDGTFIPKQNWTYFWLAQATNFLTGTKWATLRYIGTSPTGLTSDTWSLTGLAYKYQREYDNQYRTTTGSISNIDGENKPIKLGIGILYAQEIKYNYDEDVQELYESLGEHGSIAFDGITVYEYEDKPVLFEIMLGKIGYYVGEAPYKSISARNGRLTTVERWEDRNDGLYSVKDEGYDYRQFAQDIAALELTKIQNINGDILPKTSAEIEMFIDGYYFYNIQLLKRINIDNTMRANIYQNTNGFPLSVKSITISSKSMNVSLTCDNQWSRTELLEIEADYPQESDDEYIFDATETLIYSKFDPRTLKDVE